MMYVLEDMLEAKLKLEKEIENRKNIVEIM